MLNETYLLKVLLGVKRPTTQVILQKNGSNYHDNNQKIKGQKTVLILTQILIRR